MPIFDGFGVKKNCAEKCHEAKWKILMKMDNPKKPANEMSKNPGNSALGRRKKTRKFDVLL